MTYTDAPTEDITDEPESPALSDLPLQEFLQLVIEGENLVEMLDDEQVAKIAQQVEQDYKADRESMSDWFDQMKQGLDLAKLVKEGVKTHPFPGAANVCYPLVTTAALQYNARAYPAIVAADRVVKCKVYGDDSGGQKADRANRVSEFESWQLSSQIPEWEPETDKLLLQLFIVGDMYRKWWWDPVSQRPRCRLIEPGKFIVNSKAQSLELAPRATEELTLYPYEITERINSGWFAEFDYTENGEATEEPQDFIEQHTRIDLDGDGYPEPYIATLHCDSNKLVRLVADFSPDDVDLEMGVEQVPTMEQVPTPVSDGMGGVAMAMQSVERMVDQEVPVAMKSIRRGSYFVHFQIMPSMGGGLQGTGFGVLLGDISNSINTIINLLLDAGHYASLGGGFIGSGLRLRGGSAVSRPGQYTTVNAQGATIRDNIVDRTFPGPDPTLFQLMGVLIDAGREISSVKDIMTGDAGRQNQTATTTLALIEQGMMVFTATYKRVFRALKQEYRLLTKINAETVTPEQYSAFHDVIGEDGQPAQFDPREEFGLGGMDIEPVADPRTVTKAQMAAEAQFLMELAQQGMVDIGPAVDRMLQALDIGDTEELLPKPDPMAPIMAEMQMEMAHTDLVLKKVEVEKVLAETEAERAKAMKDISDAESMARGQRLQLVEMMLKDERERLETAIRARTEGMARASGDNGNARGGGQGGQGQSAAPDAALLAGPGAAGGGAAGGLAGGGMGGPVL